MKPASREVELEGNSNAATPADCLRQLGAQYAEPLTVIRDNSPAPDLSMLYDSVSS